MASKTKKDSRERRIYQVTLMGSVVNMVLLLAKFATGIFCHSAAMIADAVHSLSDFLTDIVVMVMVRLSSKPADKDHDYGHGKYETIASSIVGMALMLVAILLAWNGIMKIIDAIHGKQLEVPGVLAFLAAIVSIVAKEIVFRLTRQTARAVKSQALEANAWHHRSDALSSIGTAIGIGGAIMLGQQWAVLDPIAAVVVSFMIFYAAFRILRQASGELLEESLPESVEQKICDIVYRDPLASDIHQLYTRRIGNNIAIEMHLRLPGDLKLSDAHQHASSIERAIRAEFGADTHIMLHIEPTKD